MQGSELALTGSLKKHSFGLKTVHVESQIPNLPLAQASLPPFTRIQSSRAPTTSSAPQPRAPPPRSPLTRPSLYPTAERPKLSSNPPLPPKPLLRRCLLRRLARPSPLPLPWSPLLALSAKLCFASLLLASQRPQWSSCESPRKGST